MKRLKPPKGGSAYRQMWRVVDGAVMDCLKMHTDYVEPDKIRRVRESIAKRVTGAVLAYATEAAKSKAVKGPIRE